MADPTIKTSSVRIKYASTDGYSMDADYTNRGPKKAEPHKMLLEGFAELARILALFGFEQQAAEASAKSFAAVQEWRDKRASAS